MEQEVLNLANQQTQLAISNALNCLIQSEALKPQVLLRCQSISDHKNSPFHHTIPRCSIPETKTDLVQYQTRFPAYHGMNRTFNVQYSFSLNQSWLTKLNQQQSNLNSIQNFVDEFVEHSIDTALIQIECEYPITECPQEMNSYADQFIHSTIDQALGNISSLEIKLFSNHLTEDIIADALSSIADDENYFRKIKQRSVQLENTEQQQIILYPSSARDSSSSTNKDSVDSLVNNIAQQIYIHSLDGLRHVFTLDKSN